MHKSVAVLNVLIYLEDLAKICLLILMSLDFPCVLVPNAVVTCFISAIVFSSGTIAKRLVASLFCSSGRLEIRLFNGGMNYVCSVMKFFDCGSYLVGSIFLNFTEARAVIAAVFEATNLYGAKL